MYVHKHTQTCARTHTHTHTHTHTRARARARTQTLAHIKCMGHTQKVHSTARHIELLSTFTAWTAYE